MECEVSKYNIFLRVWIRINLKVNQRNPPAIRGHRVAESRDGRHACELLSLSGGISLRFNQLQIPRIHHPLCVARCPNRRQTTCNIYGSLFYSLALELLCFAKSLLRAPWFEITIGETVNILTGFAFHWLIINIYQAYSEHLLSA